MKSSHLLIFVLSVIFFAAGCTKTVYKPYTQDYGGHKFTSYYPQEEVDPVAVSTAAIFIGAGLSQLANQPGGIPSHTFNPNVSATGHHY